MKIRLILPAALIAALCSSTMVFAETFSTGFETDTPGAINSAPASPGNTWWQNPNGVSTGDYTAAVGAAHSGNQALEVGHDSSGSQGPIAQIWSPILAQPAGEAVANKRFYSSLWVRTVDEDGSVPGGQDFWFANGAYGDDRMSVFGLYGTPDGTLQALAVNNGFNFVGDPAWASLDWGAWYRMETTIDFVPGLGGGLNEGNDVVTYSLYDATNNLIGSPLVTISIEQFGATYADRLNLTTTYGGGVHPDGPMVYVDDVIIQTVPEPSSVLLVSLGLIGLVRGTRLARRRAG